MDIVLLRHGDCGKNYGLKLPDKEVYLTPEGIKQAHIAGAWLKNYLYSHYNNQDNKKLWISTFKRARQTAIIINSYLNIPDISESDDLIEHSMGICRGMPSQEIKERFPQDSLNYEYAKAHGGLYNVKFPTGESAADVGERVKKFICENRLKNDQPGVLVIVSHAIALTCFVKEWFGYSDDWYDTAEKLGNCWIRYIEDDKDHGFIFKQ